MSVKVGREPEVSHDEHAEAAVLGCVFIEPAVLGEVRSALRGGEFWRKKHRVIFEAMCEVADRGDAPDYLTVCDCLEAHGHVETAGGAAYVTSLPNLVPNSAGAMQWARMLLKHSAKRVMLELAAAYGQASQRDDAEPVAEIEKLQARLADIKGRMQGNPAHAGERTISFFPIMTDTEIQELQPARGIVGDILFEDSIAYLFGDSDTWKSFVTISMGLCMATGTEWLGREVVQGPVIYIAAESARGIGKRVKAWKLHHGITDSTDFYTVPVPVNLLDREAVARLVLSIRAFPRLGNRRPVMVVFDTLSRSMEDGDENSTADANKVTAAAGMLKAEFGCCVLIVHHNGKDASRGMRGNSAYRNNADTVIKVVAPALHEDERRQPGDPVTLRSVKAKESDPFEDVTFTTKRRSWGVDEVGATDSSLVVIATDAKPLEAQEAVFTDNLRKALNALGEAQEPLTSTAWQAATRIPERSFYVARRDLCARAYVTEQAIGRNKLYSITESGRDRIGAKLQNRCKKGAIAPVEEKEELSIGATGAVAPIEDEIRINPEIFGGGIGAAETLSLYVSAPLHLSTDPEVWGDDDAHTTKEVS